MKKTFADLPGWSFDVREVSAGVYEVVGTDARGLRVEAKGTDPDRLISQCKQDALDLERRVVDRTR
jgi:hypothetical protein